MGYNSNRNTRKEGRECKKGTDRKRKGYTEANRGRKIRESRYNKKFKEIEITGDDPRHLEGGNAIEKKDGAGIRAFMRLRCGNLEEENKYWLIVEERECVFREKGRDSIKHFVENAILQKNGLRI